MRTNSPSRGRLVRTTLALLALGTVAAVPALAAPARSGTLSEAAPVFAWDGGPGNGVGQGTTEIRCTPVVYECEDTLIELKAAGDVAAVIQAGSGSTDLDVYIYKSDSAGTVEGEPVAQENSDNKDAKATARKLKPGFYVVRVIFYNATQGAYKGSATLTVPPPPPPPAPPAPPATTPPAAAKPAPKPASKKKKSSKKAKCTKKAKKIKNKKKRAKALKRCKKIKG